MWVTSESMAERTRERSVEETLRCVIDEVIGSASAVVVSSGVC